MENINTRFIITNKVQGFYYIEDVKTGEFTNELINRCYDGIQITNSTTDVMYYDGRYVGPRTDYVVFDGRQLRSPFAGFDPKKADSRKILASGVGTVGAGGVAGALGGLPNGDIQR